MVSDGVAPGDFLSDGIHLCLPGCFHSVKHAGRMQVWGHRGSLVPGPENTPEVVQAALAAGARGCEVDVRRSRDGVLFCHHDPARGSRALIDTLASDLIAAGVPLLSDVIAAAGTSRLVLEVKNAAGEPDFTSDAVCAQLLVSFLAELVDLPDVLISSFDPASLEVARAAGWPVGLLTLPGVSVAEGLAAAAQAGYQELHAHVSVFDAPSAALIPQARHAGLRLVAWTVTSVKQAISLMEHGLDAVICDDPAAVVAALAQRAS
jgi:glycerophosphoryl diester phosphodiesterase